MVEIDKDTWQWDPDKVEVHAGAEGQQLMDSLLMRAAGTDDVDDAERVLLGRPRVGEDREDTVRLQVRVPRSWQRSIDTQARREHVSRSEFLRGLIARGAAVPA